MANTEQKSKSFVRLYRIALIGILTAIAVVLMMFEFPLLWIAPGFYKMDFSELPIIIGALALGPVEGIVMEFLKNLLNILLQGTVTVGIGEFANFAMGVCYVLPAALIYAFKKTKKRAVIGLIIATFMCAILGALLNDKNSRKLCFLPALGLKILLLVLAFAGYCPVWFTVLVELAVTLLGGLLARRALNAKI